MPDTRNPYGSAGVNIGELLSRAQQGSIDPRLSQYFGPGQSRGSDDNAPSFGAPIHSRVQVDGSLDNGLVQAGGPESWKSDFFHNVDPSQFKYDPEFGWVTDKKNVKARDQIDTVAGYVIPALIGGAAFSGIAAGAGAGSSASAGGYVDTIGNAIEGANAGASLTGPVTAGVGGGGGGYVDTLGDAITGADAGASTTGPLASAAAPGSSGYMDTIGDTITGADSGASLTGPVTPNYWELYGSKLPGLISKLPGILGALGGKKPTGGTGAPGGMSGAQGRAVDGINVQAKHVDMEMSPYMKPLKSQPIKSLGDYLKGG